MSIWLQKSALIELRTSPLKFDDLAEKSEKDSVPNLSNTRQHGSSAIEGVGLTTVQKPPQGASVRPRRCPLSQPHNFMGVNFMGVNLWE